MVPLHPKRPHVGPASPSTPLLTRFPLSLNSVSFSGSLPSSLCSDTHLLPCLIDCPPPGVHVRSSFLLVFPATSLSLTASALSWGWECHFYKEVTRTQWELHQFQVFHYRSKPAELIHLWSLSTLPMTPPDELEQRLQEALRVEAPPVCRFIAS